MFIGRLWDFGIWSLLGSLGLGFFLGVSGDYLGLGFI
jgi:hypothetical protein